MLIRASLLIVIYFTVLGYPPLRLLTLCVPHWQPDTATLLAVLVLPACGWIGHRRRPGRLTTVLLRLVMNWLGVCFIALVALLVLEPLLALLDLRAPAAGYLALAVIGGLLAMAAASAQRLRVRRHVIGSRKLDHALRLVQVSDVHIGSRLPHFLARVVARINAEQPDMVVITGDLVDHHGISSADLAPLGKLRAPVWFCTGNHERYIDCDAICERLSGHGVRVLRNAAESSNALRIVGIDDAEDRQQVRRQLQRLDLQPGPFTVLLYHRPDDFEAAARRGVDLMLCGHTHNGQIVPFNLLVRRVFPRIAGLYHRDGAVLHVSSGTGTWGPSLRLGSVNEITVFDLQPRPPRDGQPAVARM